ncbi:MAG: hypothetical protein LBR80_07885 [Deltaproteobacteria bacterium]|jgi:hypothetical protein|nr:hypothetical protein [Deltaproteobacteria bacterium]
MTRLAIILSAAALAAAAFPAATASAADPPAVEWAKAYGGSSSDEFVSVAATRDGGVVAAGWTDSEDGDVTNYHGGRDAWVAKLDREGNLEWQRTFGGGYEEGAGYVAQTSDGGYILTGHFNSADGDFGGQPKGGGVFVARLDPSGNKSWLNGFGADGHMRLLGAFENRDGGFLVVGSAQGSSAGPGCGEGVNLLVIRLDAGGPATDISCPRTGGSGFEPRSASGTGDGGAVFTGLRIDEERGSAAVSGEIGPDGAVRWTAEFPEDEGAGRSADAVAALADGGLAGAGGMSAGGTERGWIFRLAEGGRTAWEKVLDDVEASWLAAAAESAGGVFAAGGKADPEDPEYGDRDILAVMTDGRGERLWTFHYGGSGQETAYSATSFADGGLALAGSTGSRDGDLAWRAKDPSGGTPGAEAESDALIVKLAPPRAAGQ